MKKNETNIRNQVFFDLIAENILNFVVMSSTHDMSSIFDWKFDQFCIEILLEIHHNMKCLIIDSVFMDRIFHAVDYPNLVQLQILNFNKAIVSYYFKGNEFTYIDFCSKIEIRNIIKKQTKDYAILNFFLV